MRYWLPLFSLGVAIAWGCAPDVLIARDDSNASAGEPGGGAPGEPTGGAAGAREPNESGAAGMAGAREGGAAGSEGSVEPMRPSLLLADSVADFSLVQGERGWYYGFDTGMIDTFMLLPRTDVVTAYVPVSNDTWDCWVTADEHWTQIFQLGAHANGTDSSPPSTPVLERAVRRWNSSYDGDVRIVGELAKIDVTPGGSNGVFALILVDGVEVFSTLIGGEDAGGLSYEADANVEVGSTIDFVLDPHESNDHHDLTRFTAVIERAMSQSG